MHHKDTSRIDDEDEDGAKSGMVRSFQVHGIAIWLGRYGNDRFAQQLGRNQWLLQAAMMRAVRPCFGI